MSELDEIEKKSISASEMTDVEYCIYFVAQQGMLSRENAKDAAAELSALRAVAEAARRVVQARKAVDLDRAMQQLAHALAALESEQKGRP